MFSLMPRRRDRRAGRDLTTRERTPFDLLRQEFASLFDRAFAPWMVPWEPEAMTGPWTAEMEETDHEFVIRAELPGFELSEIDVRLAGDVLTIVAEHKEETRAEGERPVERRRGRWEETVTLPPGVEPEKAEAVYRNGVLEVRIPKVPGPGPRRIEVKT
ncbi:MAG TPA: Hsp20/alpha crystallin family protein [Gemmataceae bacterium]|nr:Hsp20/alpha crystallin family protein [Gemmataceae bacterium]